MKEQVLYFFKNARDELVNYVSGLYPEEACGFLAGSRGVVEYVIPVTNILHQQTRFKMDAQEQVHAMAWMGQKNLMCLGIFHSHSEGEAYPSETDKKEYAYPEIPAFICAPDGKNWVIKAFWIVGDAVREESIEVL